MSSPGRGRFGNICHRFHNCCIVADKRLEKNEGNQGNEVGNQRGRGRGRKQRRESNEEVKEENARKRE